MRGQQRREVRAGARRRGPRAGRESRVAGAGRWRRLVRHAPTLRQRRGQRVRPAPARGRECSGEQPVRAARGPSARTGRRPDRRTAGPRRTRVAAGRARDRPRPGPPAPERQPPDPEVTARATQPDPAVRRARPRRRCSSPPLPLPWQAAAALVRARRARRRRPGAGRRGPRPDARAGADARRRRRSSPCSWTLILGVQLALWPVQQDKQECLEGALTISAQERLRGRSTRRTSTTCARSLRRTGS